jgi:hypothetical protein
MKYFKIQTLQDGENGMDPLAILTAGAGVLTSIFPNLFNTRTKLTRAMVDQIFPGSGYWTVKLKSYLLGHTDWTVDMRYWYPFEQNGGTNPGYIRGFVNENKQEICGNCDSATAWLKFQDLLRAEGSGYGSGSGSGGGGSFPGYGSLPLNTYLIAGGVVVLAILLGSKKKGKK